MRRPDRPTDRAGAPRGPIIEDNVAPRRVARRRGPLRIDEGDPAFPGGAGGATTSKPAPTPAEAPAPPPMTETYGATHEGDAEASAAAVRAVKAAAASGGSRIGALFWGSVAALVGLGISVAAYDFVAGLIMRNPMLGAIAGALTAIIVGALAIFVLREVAATARLGRVDTVRERATKGLGERDRAVALTAVRDLRKLYAKRRDMEWGLDRLRGREGDLLDADTLLSETERLTMEPLDRRAEEAVGKAARSVAMLTAMVPMALVDVLAALLINLRMIRSVAEVYGGRAGWLGSWRLLRAVAGHLIATGAVAIGDDMLGSVVGGGVVARLSRRLGEGLINGALTARVGAAAIEVCRPLPFHALPRPSGRALAAKALKGIVGGGGKEKG
jgi:putative membrane protein